MLSLLATPAVSFACDAFLNGLAWFTRCLQHLCSLRMPLMPLQNYRIRVLDTDKYETTKQMQEQTEMFVGKITELNDTVKKYMDLIDQQVRSGIDFPS